MTQYSRPASTVDRGSWLPSSNLHLSIDEALYDDGDTATVEDDGDGTSYAMMLTMGSVSDPVSGSDHVISTRAKTQNGWGNVSLVVKLLQAGTPDTLIATQTISVGNSTTWTDYTMTLTSSEANAISNYAGLKAQVIATDLNESDEITVLSQLFLSVPDAGVAGAGAVHHKMYLGLKLSL
jgi:hypothetical protein